MTDTYLRSLGFVPTVQSTRATLATFNRSWRYQYDHLAADGAPLFIEHPIGIATCRLSTLEAPLQEQDIIAHVDLHDRPALEAAMTTFYATHGGIGDVLPSVATNTYRPFRRAL